MASETRTFLACSAAVAALTFLSFRAVADTQPPRWRAFELPALENAVRAGKELDHRFLDQPAIQAGIVFRAPAEGKAQTVFDRDAVYIVTSGDGEIAVDSKTVSVGSGSILFIRAGVAHRFQNIGEPVTAVVVSSSAKSNEADPEFVATTLDQARRSAAPNRNVWNRFFDFKALHLGLYLLPMAVGGDRPLVHEVDEINVVTRGRGTFQVGDDQIAVRPGSIIWVGEGNPHFFHSLTEDLEILILFHQKPGVRTP